MATTADGVGGGVSGGGVGLGSSLSSSRHPPSAVEAAAMLELSQSADAASQLPPQALLGQWVSVEGLGLGRVLAFHKQWAPGTNSLHSIEFGGRWGGRGGGLEESVVEKVLLRRSKLRNVHHWGTGRMNGGRLFALSHPPPPLQSVHGEDGDDEDGGEDEDDEDGGEDGGEEAAAAALRNEEEDRVPDLLLGSGGVEGGDEEEKKEEERQRIRAGRFRARSLARIQATLPPGWLAALDPATQRPFFVNERDPSVSQWETPTAPAASPPPPSPPGSLVAPTAAAAAAAAEAPSASVPPSSSPRLSASNSAKKYMDV